MSRPRQLTDWQADLARRLPDLRPCVIAVLALYSFGVVLAGACGLSRVALFLAEELGLREGSLRKRLSEFYKDKADKPGPNRRDFDPASCFAPLLRWVLSLCPGDGLALAVDATNLGDRFHVLCASVVVRGTALPVAWKVLPAGLCEAWNPHWIDLLTRLEAAVPAGRTVLVLSDRGLESPELFRAVADLGWHPMMRVKKGGTFRPAGRRAFVPLSGLVENVGRSYSARGCAYKRSRLTCTLLATWREGCGEPWFVLTDLAPEAATALWYGLRTWVEQGFKAFKGGGWDWHLTRMEDAERVERVWLVLSVAALWVTAVGAEDEAGREEERSRREGLEAGREAEQGRRREKARARAEKARARRRAKAEARARRLDEARRLAGKAAKPAAALPPAKPKAAGAATGRPHRVFLLGRAILLALWPRGENRLPRGLHPEPWPTGAEVASPPATGPSPP